MGRATVPAVPEDQHILRLRMLPASSASAPPPSEQQQPPQILEGVLEMVRASDAAAAGRAAVRAVSLEPSQSKAERKRKAPLPALHPAGDAGRDSSRERADRIEAVVSSSVQYGLYAEVALARAARARGESLRRALRARTKYN